MRRTKALGIALTLAATLAAGATSLNDDSGWQRQSALTATQDDSGWQTPDPKRLSDDSRWQTSDTEGLSSNAG